MPVTRPPFDLELSVALDALRAFMPATVTPEMIQPMGDVPPAVEIDDLLAGRPITRTDHTVPGHQGDAIEVTALARTERSGTGPGILQLHGGGMVLGDRFGGIDQPLAWVERFDAVCVTVG